MKVWRHLRVALWLAGCAAAGAESATNSAPLDLASCVDQALQYNLGLSVRRYGPRQAREDLIIANAAFDARLDAAADASESRASKAASELEGSDQPISRNNSGSLGVNKKISSGATVGRSTDLDRSDTDSEFATLNPSYNAGLGVEFRQPLLKGGGSTVTLAPVRQGEIAVRRADLDLRAAALDLARDTELAYWKLEYAIEDLRVVEIALQIALRLVQETRARQAAGLATPVDDAADRLRAYLGPCPANPVPPVPARPLPTEIGAVPTPEIALERARRNQPEYLSRLEAIQSRRLDVAVARRNRWPTLNLAGSAGYAGRDGDVGDAYDAALRGDGYRWRIGMELSAPWGLHEERARLRKAEYGLAEEEIRLDQVDQELELQIRAACRAATAAAERVSAAEITRRLREEQFEKMEAQYRAGTSPLRDRLDAQNELESARLRELRARVDQITAVINLGRLEGSLLERHGLEWKEVMP